MLSCIKLSVSAGPDIVHLYQLFRKLFRGSLNKYYMRMAGYEAIIHRILSKSSFMNFLYLYIPLLLIDTCAIFFSSYRALQNNIEKSHILCCFIWSFVRRSEKLNTSDRSASRLLSLSVSKVYLFYVI